MLGLSLHKYPCYPTPDFCQGVDYLLLLSVVHPFLLHLDGRGTGLEHSITVRGGCGLMKSGQPWKNKLQCITSRLLFSVADQNNASNSAGKKEATQDKHIWPYVPPKINETVFILVQQYFYSEDIFSKVLML